MTSYHEDLRREEFMKGFADVHKPDAFERRCREAIVLSLVAVECILLGIAYACGARWGL